MILVNPSLESGPQPSQTEFASDLLPRLRLRTRFLLSMLLITTGLTTTSLLLVQRSIRGNVRQSIAVNLSNSVAAFRDFRHERETMLTSDVALLADIPLTRAIMTSTDPVTIQDASQDVWQHARSSSDLFVLADRSGKVVAMHTKTPGFTREAAEKYFQQSLDEDSGDSSHWWFGEHHLYQAFVQAKAKTGEDTHKLSAAGFKEFVRKKTKDLQEKQNCQNVEYVVEVVAGQVKLKALVKS